MTSIQELCADQEHIGQQIQKLITNFKKDSADRKTRKYFELKYDELQAAWVRFEDIDTSIRNNKDVQKDDVYFTADYYGKIKDLYVRYMAIFENGIKQFESEQQATTSSSSKVSNQATNTDISSMIRKQAAMRNSLERIFAGIAHTSNPTNSHNKVMLESIDKLWTQIEATNFAIWEKCSDPAQSGYDMDAYIALEEAVTMQRILLNTRQGIDNVQSTRNEHALQLPKIAIPQFDGDYLKWQQFADIFTKMIHEQPIPSVQKMWYLKTSLVGEAAGLIQHFTSTEANYDAAWKVIKERYANPRLLTDAIIGKLLAQPTIHQETASAVKVLHDTTAECLLSLNNLGVDTHSWDPLLLHILIQRLSKATHVQWEQSLDKPRETPTLKQFLNFLERRFQALESLVPKIGRPEPHKRLDSFKALSVTVDAKPCIICNNQHPLFACDEFLQMAPKARLAAIQKSKYCVNCLKGGHASKDCSSRLCTKCNKKHNTLLHLDNRILSTRSKVQQLSNTSSAVFNKGSVARSPSSKEAPQKMLPTTRNNTETATSLTAIPKDSQKSKTTLLSTVRLRVKDNFGREIDCRAVLDSGSQANFTTKRLATKLGLRKIPQLLGIEGIGNTCRYTTDRVNIELISRTTGFSARVEAQILPKIVSDQPAQHVDVSSWKVPSNIPLADPEFSTPGPIDLLIGAGLFYHVLSVGQIILGPELPVLQNTLFGWVVGGEHSDESSLVPTITCGIGSKSRLDEAVENFWRLEVCDTHTDVLTAAERCVTHFYQNVQRHNDAGFMVRLPFQGEPNQLGESKDIALQRFLTIEKKLNRNLELKESYVKFMREYEALGHMEKVSLSKIGIPHYFLPHHGVLRPESSSTKLRVVFDASAKASSNCSLNDILYTAPNLQPDVFTILLRFRLPSYTFTADIAKMYRQMWIHSSDRKYQLIWWRENPALPLQCYQLNTVTYGTTCAPFLAIQCLQHLAEQLGDRYPLAAEVIKNNFYVDDCLCGSNNIATALDMQSQLLSLMQLAGLELHKWCSNDKRLLSKIPVAAQVLQLDVENRSMENSKAMGLTWNPTHDTFTISIEKSDDNKITKRSALGDVSRIFDPLGFVAPVVVTAKIFLQKLWRLKIDWDAALPQDLHTFWQNFRRDLPELTKVTVQRHVFGLQTPKSFQIHIFADASEQAYGTVAYVRTITAQGILLRFLCAKSKVAPIKQVSVPRLELCAAKLAVDVMLRIQQDLKIKKETINIWTDSTAVLGWISATSAHYHTFVANRVASIQRHTTPQQWKHVQSHQNPADIVSRGLTPEKIAENNFWYYGPIFLHGSEQQWPPQPVKHKQCELERRSEVINVLTANTNPSCDFITNIKHSNSFRRLQRIIAYMLRFKKQSILRPQTIEPNSAEMERALQCIIKIIQKIEFAPDITNLQRHKSVNRDSSINSLAPFMAADGILRVGGRLQSAVIKYDSKHPMILPYHHPVTKMLLIDLHKEHLHVGPQTLLSIARQRFWPIKGKTLARDVVKKCVQCVKMQPKLLTQLMGNLPTDRIQPARPFINTGVDFFGPVWTHFRIRGKRPQKAYVAVFCCFATKAVHMELVSELTTEAFLGALKRFVGRRGHCQKIYCDNATNFVGARNQLQELQGIIQSETAKEKIVAGCSKKCVEFQFIPPRAPHFGGLWEAAVKSAKHLLVHTLSSASLTYEEMQTVVIEAEAILNSRPITPMSSDPNDLTALTPGHLLIGEPLVSTIDPHATSNQLNLPARLKLVTHIKAEFWRRWSQEYLSQLQHRYKWKKECHNITPGTLVVIKEDNLPPLKWSLGRVLHVVSGNDGLVRVVDVRTQSSIVRRAIHKIAPLPVEPSTIDQPEEDITRKRESDAERAKRSKSESSDRNTKRKRTSIGSALVSMFTVLLFVCPGQGNDVTIQPFDHDPGIYFENLGAAGIAISDWNLITFFKLQTYWDEFEAIQQYLSSLEKVCKAIEETDVACSAIMRQIHRISDDIRHSNEILSPENSRRNKRGALDIIGNVARSMFGVLDSEYADEIATTIDKIYSNEDHLAAALRNQTSFIDTTLHIIKRSQQEVHGEFNKIKDALQHVNSQILKIKQNFDQEVIRLNFYEMTLHAVVILSNYERVQNSLLDILIDSHQGKMNLQLVPPDLLQAEIMKIKTNSPKSISLPLDTNQLLRFYQLMSIESQITKTYIIFKLKLPLISTESFELLKLTPIPWKSEMDLKIINLSTPYLIINLHRDLYYPLSETELQFCILLQENYHICQPHSPIFKRGSSASSCEVNLLDEGRNLASCNIRTIDTDSYWVRLHNPNSWIYATKIKTLVKAVCSNNNLSQIPLEQSGIMTIKEGCTIKLPLLTIQGQQSIKVNRDASYIPFVNVSMIQMKHQFDDSTSPQIRHSSHTTLRTTELTQLQQQLSKFEINDPEKFRKHDLHHYALGYGNLIGLIIIGAIIFWKLYQKLQTSTPTGTIPKATKKMPNDIKSSDSASNPEDTRFNVIQC